MFVPLAFAQERLSSIVKQVQPSVVTITTHDESGRAVAQGSGFFVNEGGHIITNRHVVEDAIRAEIKTAEGKVYSVAKVVAEDREGDLVRLSVDIRGDTVKPISLSRNLPEAGERILVIGSPLGLEQTVSEGIVSAIRGSGRLIQITAPISHGSSGSPVVNMKGQVIGVATLIFTEGQNLNFAVAAERISKMKSGEGKTLALWAAGAYGEGLEFLEQKNYRAALKTLTEFLKENPNSKYAANGQYSIGEAYYALGEFIQANAAFLRVKGQYPNSQVVPASLRMAAASLAHLFAGKLNALNSLAIHLDEYPQSEEIVKTRNMLRDWDKEDNPYVGQKGSLTNVRNVTLTINSNDVLMKCANPEWKALRPSDICQRGEGLFMQASELRSMILDMFRRKLPGVVIDEPNLVGIARGYVPKIAIQQDWIPVSIYVGSTVEKGNIQFFGVVSMIVARSQSTWNKNPWRGKIPAPHEQSEEHGMVRYFSGSGQTIHAAIQQSLDSLFTSFAEHWQRDNPKPSMSPAGPLPRFWKYPSGRETEIQVEGDYLYEKAKQGKYTLSDDKTEIQVEMETETYCETKRDGSEWSGKCRYSTTGRNFSTPCVIETKEIVTLLTPTRIEGKSQRIDASPLKQKPPACPQPGAEETGWEEFSLTPKE